MGGVGSKAQHSTVQCSANTHRHTILDANIQWATLTYCIAKEKALKLDVKSPELPQTAIIPLLLQKVLHSVKKHQACTQKTHTHTHTKLSSLTVSPHCITLLGMHGGGSLQPAQLNARSHERLWCCVFATGEGGREIVYVMHLDLFWHTNNYSPHLLEEQLNVASKVLKFVMHVEVSLSDDDCKCLSSVSLIGLKHVCYNCFKCVCVWGGTFTDIQLSCWWIKINKKQLKKIICLE